MDMTSGRASSPLREHDSSSGEWVQRTEDVHLNEVENQGNDRYRELYDRFLGMSLAVLVQSPLCQELISTENIPPPFTAYNTYYVIPKSFEQDLKALALNDAETKTEASPTDLQLNMKDLVETVEGEEVYVLQTWEQPDGTSALGGDLKKDVFWNLKDGLVEDDDFLFIHQTGWDKIIEW